MSAQRKQAERAKRRKEVGAVKLRREVEGSRGVLAGIFVGLAAERVRGTFRGVPHRLVELVARRALLTSIMHSPSGNSAERSNTRHGPSRCQNHQQNQTSIVGCAAL